MDLTSWFNSWSEGPESFENVVGHVVHAPKTASEFHTTGWDPSRGIGMKFKELMRREGWSLEHLQFIKANGFTYAEATKAFDTVAA